MPNEPLSMLAVMSASETAEQRLASPKLEMFQKIIKHRVTKGVGLLLASAVLGLIARNEISTQALGDWVLQRFANLTLLDTGPSTASNLIAEGLSIATALTGAWGYLGLGEGVKRWVANEKVKKGLADVPSKWKDHLIVVDPQRGIFDAFDIASPMQQKVLLHDGSLMTGDMLGGGSLTSKIRRHVNAVGREHLSDGDILLKTAPERAKTMVFNMTSRDNILGASLVKPKGEKNSLEAAKVHNMLTTLRRMGGDRVPNIVGIVPEGAKWELGDVSSIFSKQRFLLHAYENSVRVFSPEEIFVQSVKKGINGRKFALKTNIPGLNKLLDPMLKSAGINVVSEEQAEVVAVYFTKDDLTNAVAEELVEHNNGKVILTCLERAENLDEAPEGSEMWYLPQMIAQHVTSSLV